MSTDRTEGSNGHTILEYLDAEGEIDYDTENLVVEVYNAEEESDMVKVVEEFFGEDYRLRESEKHEDEVLSIGGIPGTMGTELVVPGETGKVDKEEIKDILTG